MNRIKFPPTQQRVVEQSIFVKFQRIEYAYKSSDSFQARNSEYTKGVHCRFLYTYIFFTELRVVEIMVHFSFKFRIFKYILSSQMSYSLLNLGHFIIIFVGWNFPYFPIYAYALSSSSLFQFSI
jgi:hypothetical protein